MLTNTNQTMVFRADTDGSLVGMHDSVIAIYENDAIIGWCTTRQEADAICEKLSHLQWGKKKKTTLPAGAPHLIASVLIN